MQKVRKLRTGTAGMASCCGAAMLCWRPIAPDVTSSSGPVLLLPRPGAAPSLAEGCAMGPAMPNTPATAQYRVSIDKGQCPSDNFESWHSLRMLHQACISD
jgi:hypothetical protein